MDQHEVRECEAVSRGKRMSGSEGDGQNIWTVLGHFFQRQPNIFGSDYRVLCPYVLYDLYCGDASVIVIVWRRRTEHAPLIGLYVSLHLSFVFFYSLGQYATAASVRTNGAGQWNEPTVGEGVKTLGCAASANSATLLHITLACAFLHCFLFFSFSSCTATGPAASRLWWGPGTLSSRAGSVRLPVWISSFFAFSCVCSSSLVLQYISCRSRSVLLKQQRRVKSSMGPRLSDHQLYRCDGGCDGGGRS